jgi:acetyltransferase-like isoleucine patch superfamily enzyme
MNSISEKAILGKNVTIGEYCIIEEGAEIGDNTSIGPFSIVRSNAKIGSNCKFTAYCEIRSNVEIGSNTTFGSRCTISANGIIGDNVSVKYGFVLTDTPDLKENDKKSVGSIGDNSLIGANVCLMPGVSIGKNCIIGANSQVRQDTGDNEVWFGVPAKLYKKNE